MDQLAARASVRRRPFDPQGRVLIRGSDRRVVGYFLLKGRFYPSASQRGFRDVTPGSLADWMIFDPTRLHLDQLLLFAVRALLAWEPDAIELCLEPGSAGSRLRRWGFPRLGALHIFVRASARSPLSAGHVAGQQSAWRLRPAEGDNFFP